MTVRAKFRCMSVTTTYEKIITADFRPAMPQKGADGTPEHEENKAFFKWTPGGEMVLGFYAFAPDGTPQPPALDLEPGVYYYIDFEPHAADADVARPWVLVSRTEHMASEQLDVELCAHWASPGDSGPERLRNASLKMQINNPGAWPLFLTAKRGARWAVTIVRAG